MFISIESTSLIRVDLLKVIRESSGNSKTMIHHPHMLFRGTQIISQSQGELHHSLNPLKITSLQSTRRLTNNCM